MRATRVSRVSRVLVAVATGVGLVFLVAGATHAAGVHHSQSAVTHAESTWNAAVIIPDESTWN